jgi:hypothetical protein
MSPLGLSLELGAIDVVEVVERVLQGHRGFLSAFVNDGWLRASQWRQLCETCAKKEPPAAAVRGEPASRLDVSAPRFFEGTRARSAIGFGFPEG